MKKALLLSAILIFVSSMFIVAQDKLSGSVIYEETVKFEIKLEGEMAHLMKDMPKEQKSEKILYFNHQASLYTNVEKEENNTAGGMESGMRFFTSTPDQKLYIDLEKEEIIEQREFMTRMFLINSDMPSSEWKITGEQLMILDYPCMEATKTDTAGVITRVWFAPSLQVKSGPGHHCNLPGLVLAVEQDEGKRKLMAQSVSFDEPDKNLLKKPKDGKKVSSEEFEKIVAEKMKEMGAEGGVSSGAHVMIKIKH